MIVADWIGGLSIGWWCDVSPVAVDMLHRLMIRTITFTIVSTAEPYWVEADILVVTNHPEHDPDIQHIPFFAISKQFFGSLWSTYYKRVMAFDGFSKVMISVQ